MEIARYWKKLENKKVQCQLCNHFCLIEPDNVGKCGVRLNKDGVLYSLVYGEVVAENVDPIEKKPFYHFFPGSFSFSIATCGCNFFCPFCQNYEISHPPKEGRIFTMKKRKPEDIVKLAKSYNCLSISYTYTEPTVFGEFAFDTCKIAKENGLYNNFVTNGYMSKEFLKDISEFLDAANVDLKGDEEFYKKLPQANQKYVVENIELMRKLNIWVEVTTLLIPEYNDNEKQIRDIAKKIKNIDNRIPWHISRFFPAYKMSDHYPTEIEKIRKAREIGFEEGLLYVYTGNIVGDEGENTYCPYCKKLLIERYGYRILEKNLTGNKCSFCGKVIDGIFTLES